MASNSTVVVEKIKLEVVEITKKGAQGNYKQKAVSYKDKNYVVSKGDQDKVKIGQEYEFELSKSEYNDKLYYWANLKSKAVKDETDEPSVGSDDFKKKVFSYLDSLDVEKKKQVIIYLLKQI